MTRSRPLEKTKNTHKMYCKPGLTEGEKEGIIELYRIKLSIIEIASQMNWSRSAVTFSLKDKKLWNSKEGDLKQEIE